MATIKDAKYKVHNGTDFDTIHFETKASQVIASDGSNLETHLAESASDGVHNIATTQVLTYYVSTTGNDDNDGLSSSKPFKTIAYAIAQLPKQLNHNVEIILADGSYTAQEMILIYGFTGRGSLTIKGNSSNNQACSLPQIIVRSCVSRIYLNYLNLRNTSGSMLFVDGSNFVEVYNCSCIATSTSQNGLEFNASVGVVRNSTIWNRAIAIYANNLSRIYSDGNQGSNNTQALVAANGSLIAKNGDQPAGTTGESQVRGGVIR